MPQQLESEKNDVLELMANALEQHLLNETTLYVSANNIDTNTVFGNLCRKSHINLDALISAYGKWLASKGGENVPLSTKQRTPVDSFRENIMTEYFLNEINVRYDTKLAKDYNDLQRQFAELRGFKQHLTGYPKFVKEVVGKAHNLCFAQE